MKEYLSKLERMVWRDIQTKYSDSDLHFWEEYHLWKYGIITKVNKFWKDML